MTGRSAYQIGWGAMLAFGVSALALEVEVATPKLSYYLGEEFRVLITAHNSQASAITLRWPTSLQSRYTLDGVYTSSSIALQVQTLVVIPGYGSYTWSMEHDWDAYWPGYGSHSASGEVVNYGAGGPALFNVVEAPRPPGNFLIDFDTIPGTQAPVAHLMAYEAAGVHFRTVTGGAAGLQDLAGDTWLAGGWTGPTTGFNLAADFDTPVYAATMNISAGEGMSVTLVAKNAQAEVIGSLTTGPLHAYQFSTPFSIAANQPIASLEWLPSDPRSGVGIDNLYLVTVPEPSTLLLFLLSAALLGWRRGHS